MDLKVAATGSSGNCYILQDGDHRLVLDAGIPYKEFLRAVDFNIQNISGCLVSHEHMDHAQAVPDMTASGINVHMSRGTMDKVFKASDSLRSLVNIHKASDIFAVRDWTVRGFYLHHDAAEPLGFLIKRKDVKLVYLTDSASCDYTFSNLTHIIIECNYILDILNHKVEKGHLTESLSNRIKGNHMGLETLIPWLVSLDRSKLVKVVLVHLSDSNSNAEMMIREIEKKIGIEVVAAEPGQTINLSAVGF